MATMEDRPVRPSLAVAALLCCVACPRNTGETPPAPSPKDAAAQPGEVADLSELLQPILDGASTPALVAAVSDGEKLLALGSVGVRKQGDESPVTAADKMHLGSCTKAMTATLAALQVDDGQLSWTRTLAELFPGLATTMHADYRGVTIEQLLQHRGGTSGSLAQEHPDLLSALRQEGEVTTQRLSFVEALLQRAPAVTPGTEYRYSNAGYMVVGTGLEVLTGKSWETLMSEQLFTPLGMSSCGYGAPASLGQVDQPWGHTLGATGAVPVAPGPGADNPPALGPAGTVHCAMEDWARFVRVHLNGARGRSEFLSAASFARMHTPPAGGDYALGWTAAARDWAGGTALTHSGSNTMFFAQVWFAPEKDRILMAATNLGGDGARATVDEVLAALVPAWVP